MNEADLENKMSVAKFVNVPGKAADDCLEGFALSNKGIRLLKKHRVVLRSDVDDIVKKGQVCIVSGGGSGHEPSQAGFVGKGMLTAAVCGDVFASPPSTSVLKAIELCQSRAGVLLIVTNYTGDRLNFGCAAEKARGSGIKVEIVIVDDDAALPPVANSVGRRGLCGTVFVHKVAGALAEIGKSLEFIAEFANRVVKEIRTISVSLTPCSIPGQVPTFSIAHDAIEFGLGVHGEPGVKQIEMTSSFDVAKQMIDYILRKEACNYFSDVAVIVNNLGCLSFLETYVLANDVLQYLKRSGVNTKRCYVGKFMTSLEMSGVSISLFRVNDERLLLLDFETVVPVKLCNGIINVNV